MTTRADLRELQSSSSFFNQGQTLQSLDMVVAQLFCLLTTRATCCRALSSLGLRGARKPRLSMGTSMLAGQVEFASTGAVGFGREPGQWLPRRGKHPPTRNFP